MTAGLPFNYQLGNNRPAWIAESPRDEEIAGLSIAVNAEFSTLTKLRVVLDDNRVSAVALDLKPLPGIRQDFALPAKKFRKISLEPLAWTEHPKRIIGVESLAITVRRPAYFTANVVPLLNVGAMVKYPRGTGGIVLCQVRVDEPEKSAAAKRTVLATLLRNLGTPTANE